MHAYSFWRTYRIVFNLLSVCHLSWTRWFICFAWRTLWFSEGDSEQYNTMQRSFLVDASIPKSSEWRASHPLLSRYSRRLLVSGIAGHHKSIHTASRSCFEVVLWYTWHRMQHRKATWYDITQYIKVNRGVTRNVVTILSKRNPYDMDEN